MNAYFGAREYVKKMISDTTGLKILLLDKETATIVRYNGVLFKQGDLCIINPPSLSPSHSPSSSPYPLPFLCGIF